MVAPLPHLGRSTVYGSDSAQFGTISADSGTRVGLVPKRVAALIVVAGLVITALGLLPLRRAAPRDSCTTRASGTKGEQ
jgi:hypothetical protein